MKITVQKSKMIQSEGMIKYRWSKKHRYLNCPVKALLLPSKVATCEVFYANQSSYVDCSNQNNNGAGLLHRFAADAIIRNEMELNGRHDIPRFMMEYLLSLDIRIAKVISLELQKRNSLVHSLAAEASSSFLNLIDDSLVSNEDMLESIDIYTRVADVNISNEQRQLYFPDGLGELVNALPNSRYDSEHAAALKTLMKAKGLIRKEDPEPGLIGYFTPSEFYSRHLKSLILLALVWPFYDGKWGWLKLSREKNYLLLCAAVLELVSLGKMKISSVENNYINEVLNVCQD